MSEKTLLSRQCIQHTEASEALPDRRIKLVCALVDVHILAPSVSVFSGINNRIQYNNVYCQCSLQYCLKPYQFIILHVETYRKTNWVNNVTVFLRSLYNKPKT